MLVGTGVIAHYYPAPSSNGLRQQVQQLSRDVQQLQQEQAMPALVLNRYRNSICYIFGMYRLDSTAKARPARPHFWDRVRGRGRLACHKSPRRRTMV